MIKIKYLPILFLSLFACSSSENTEKENSSSEQESVSANTNDGTEVLVIEAKFLEASVDGDKESFLFESGIEEFEFNSYPTDYGDAHLGFNLMTEGGTTSPRFKGKTFRIHFIQTTVNGVKYDKIVALEKCEMDKQIDEFVYTVYANLTEAYFLVSQFSYIFKMSSGETIEFCHINTDYDSKFDDENKNFYILDDVGTRANEELINKEFKIVYRISNEIIIDEETEEAIPCKEILRIILADSEEEIVE